VVESGCPNYKGCRIPVLSKINVDFFRSNLSGFHDKGIIEFLEFGWPIGYDKDTLPVSKGNNHKGATEFSDCINSYLKKEVSLGATLGPFSSNPFLVPLAISPLNTVPKGGTSDRRVIMDLSHPAGSSVNDGVPKNTYLGEEFSLVYPTIDTFTDIVRRKGRGCLMYKRDLKRAYRQIPVDPGDLHLLGCKWQGDIYIDRTIAMGLRTGAMICQRLTTAVVFILEKLGFDVCNYIDDLAGAEEEDKASEAFDALGLVLHEAGLEEGPEKACSPADVMDFLGIQIDSKNMEARVPYRKLQEVLQELEVWSRRKSASKRQVQSLIGKLQFVARCIQPGRIFISRMLVVLKGLKKQHHFTKVSAEFRKDIDWWRRFMEVFNGVSIIPEEDWSEPDHIFASDACLEGGGAICGSQFCHFVFPADFKTWHISALELLTIVVAAKLWGHLWKGLRIRVLCDNEASVSVVNTGRSKDPLMLACVRELAYVVATRQFQLRSVHIPGVDNRIPDELSRWDLGTSHQQKFWSLVQGRVVSEVEVPSKVFHFGNEW
jgi:hypothetical protein